VGVEDPSRRVEHRLEDDVNRREMPSLPTRLLRGHGAQLFGTALYAAVVLVLTVEWLDPLADERPSRFRHWSPLVFGLLVLLHPVAGFLIGRYWALFLAAVPVGGAFWAGADCTGGGYIDLCGYFEAIGLLAALFLCLPLLAFGVFIRQSRSRATPPLPPSRYWP
jgi:hypothetical protein